MFLECNLKTSVARTTSDDYVRELTIDVRCFDENHAENYLAGRIAASQVLWTDAIADGESLFEICDNDSQGLSDVFAALCDNSGAVRSEFEIEDVFNHVMFVYHVVLHPEVQPYAKAILDVAVDLLGHEALIVMWRGLGGVPTRTWRSLASAKSSAPSSSAANPSIARSSASNFRAGRM